MDESRARKRRNAPKTKLKILAAAQKAFAEKGYSQAGIRDIAALANVSSALLLRYYGSKAALFEAALSDAMRSESVFDSGKERLGERLAAVFLDRNIDIKPPSIIGLSIADPDARDIALRVIEEQAVAPLARWLGPPDGHARALEIFLLAMSFVMYTRQLPLISAHKATEKKVAGWFAETLQRIVDRG